MGQAVTTRGIDEHIGMLDILVPRGYHRRDQPPDDLRRLREYIPRLRLPVLNWVLDPASRSFCTDTAVHSDSMDYLEFVDAWVTGCNDN